MRFTHKMLYKYRWQIVLFLGFSIAYLLFYQNKALVNIELACKSSGTFKIYWAKDGEAYSEKKLSTINTFPNVRHYSIVIGDLDKINKLRIHPVNQGNRKIRVISVRVRQKGFQQIVFHKPAHLRQFLPVDQIKKTWVDSNGLWVISSGPKPRLDLQLAPERNLGESKYAFSTFIFFLIISFLPYWRLQTLNFDYIPYLMLLVGVLIFTMASLSRFNKHPDEYVHYQASKYYQNNWVPPAICTPGTEQTYSVYGVSRLNSYETAYLFSGKFSVLWGFLPGNNYRKVRYFNVLLWFVLVLLAYKATTGRILFVPLLLSPQIWYLFSYCNSDAFALSVLFIFSYLIIEPRSVLRRYLNGQGFDRSQIIKGVLLGIVVAILCLLKLNYYFYILFLGCWGIITYVILKKRPSGKQLQNSALIALVAIFIIFGRMGWDQDVNGTEKKSKMIACREKLANKTYKPSTPLHQQAIALKMKQRGTTLKELLVDYQYLTILFRSATSAYGYMEMFAQKQYYHFMALLLTVFVGIGSFLSFHRTPPYIKLLAIIFFMCTILIISASAWRSWTIVFQPQGRYIFPIIPIVGIWYHDLTKRIPMAFFNLVVGLLFFASVYSFIWIGLLSIPKI